MASLKVNPTLKIFKETGSAFDATDFDSIKVRLFFSTIGNEKSNETYVQERAGSYARIPAKEVDVSAFSYSKKTGKPSPKEFVKKHSGFGGSMVICNIFFVKIKLLHYVIRYENTVEE